MKHISKKHIKKPVNNNRNVLIVGAGTVIGALLWIGSGTSPIPVPLYEVTNVFDGDTFETAEKQYIRISGIDAPEPGRCGYEEAKEYLKSLIGGKTVYIKILYHLGSRQTGLVYTLNGPVNTAMLASGWAVKYDKDTPNDPALQAASDDARKNKRGVFGSMCTQTVNTQSPSCVIKGNIPYRNDIKTYHMPGCPSYDMTQVELYKGDEWFCTTNDAEKAGFVKAEGCP